MRLNHDAKGFAVVGRWLASAVLGVAAIALIWQVAFFSSSVALADTTGTLVASADSVQEKAQNDANRTKGFIRDTADKVERTANRNADRIERATDGDDNIFQRRAQQDADRIEKRAEEDAYRTQRAVDNTKNAFEKAADNIKDVFSND